MRPVCYGVSIAQTIAITTLGALVTPLFILLLEERAMTLARFATVFAYSAVYANAIGIPAHWIMPRLHEYVVDLRPAWQWVILVASLTAISAGGCLASTMVLSNLNLPEWPGFWYAFRYSLRLCVFITVVFGVLIAGYEQLRGRLEETELRLRTEELQRERAIVLVTEARLASLESRLHPHFLFNTLNSISSLIPADPHQAERLVERMARLLRFSLETQRTGLVALEQEMRIVRDYLEIEKARLGPRLRYEVQASGNVSTVQLPPLSIQTLVENSIKFAVAPSLDGGEIRVRAVRDNETLRVDVLDTGSGFGIDSIPDGHGLDNLQARLEVLFGGAASLTVTRIDQWAAVTLTVPA